MDHQSPNSAAGFLIVKTFPWIYRDYVARYDLTRDVYAIPRVDRDPEDYAIQYRGLARDPLFGLGLELLEWYREQDWFIEEVGEGETAAALRLGELEEAGRSEKRFLFLREDAEDVYTRLAEQQSDYEVVWARIAGGSSSIPEGFRSAGYEPSWYHGECFSASCDCLLIPRWHGTDPEGVLFRAHVQRLNRHGLFPRPEQAQDFLDYYLSFDWTETGEYVIAEVCLAESAS